MATVGLLQPALRSSRLTYILLITISLTSGVLISFSIVLLVGIHVPVAIDSIVALVLLVGLPYLFTRRIFDIWTKDVEDFSTSHPSRFLSRVHGIRKMMLSTEIAAVPIALILVRVLTLSGLQLVEVVLLVSTEFGLIVLVIMTVRISVWHPDIYYALLASLSSDEDHERRPDSTWLDTTFDYFNSWMGSRRIMFKLKNDLNLEVLLVESKIRRLTIAGLYDAIESGDHWLFIRDVAYLAHKHPNQILERNSLTWLLKTNIGTITAVAIGLAGLSVALSPWWIPDLINLVQVWQKFLG